MDKSWSRTIWGLFLVQLSLAQIELNITCRYAGVYHVEKNGRYSISRTEAADLCKAFNSTLPTLKQMEQALSIGFETCRYGFIDGHVVIPRKTPRFLCAANNTGVYILPSNTSQYDTYCFNASAPLDKEDCSSVTDIPSIFEGQITIGIVNPDGTRYTKKGEYRTNPEDINPSFNPDDDGSSGSAGERSTMGGSTIIQTTYDDVTTTFQDLSNDDHEDFPTVTTLTSTSGTTHKTTAMKQEDSDWFSQWFWPSKRERQHTTTRTIGMESTTTSADLEPNEESEEDREKSPSYSGSGIDDDEDFISTTSASTRATSQEMIQGWTNWAHVHPNPEEQPQTTAKVTAIVDMNRSDNRAHGENSTQESQPPLIVGGNHEDYDGHHSSSTTLDIPSSTTQETTIQHQGGEWFWWHSQPPKEDAKTTAETTDTVPHHSTADPKEGWIEDKDTTDYPPVTTDSDDSHAWHPHRPVTAYSTAFPDGSKDKSGQNPNLKRKAKIPEWLIILSALLALALILAVCIAVNSRRRCGQKKKLVINNGNGAVDDKKRPGLNGDASKSQEMVHLVNKESSDGQLGRDECMTADETRNLQNVDMKIGV
ncbi:CD44 antigen isoform X23 [Petaurus breviceps papuanus]|uniref:CD44 antigen isoform X23 n=1 Tax=Petaurus breviceps papuanus TaxID=3040969 RepID=UPI0036DBCAFE